MRVWYRSRLAVGWSNRLEHLSVYRRTLLLRRQLGSCGRDITVQFPVSISEMKRLHLGDHVSIAAFVHVRADGGIHVGDRVMVASHVAISTVTHDHQARVMWNTVVTKPIRIEDDVWIGAHAVILPGVTIGRGAVVGAGSVVTHDVPPFAVVTGVPARVQRYRETVSATPEVNRCPSSS
jgi:acetyltransferase-like isoleucine patch superfamily enzyme